MQYEPIKRSVGKILSGPLFLRKFLYLLLDIILLRTWHIKKSLSELKKDLPDNSEILDAGSGFGQYTWRMCRMNRNWKITGVDINKELTDDCSVFFRKTCASDRVSFMDADLTSYRAPGKYDLILSVDVMEHIRDDESVFRNFFLSLKEKGILLISTPSDKGGSDTVNHNDESFIGEHVRNGYSISGITGKLLTAGFRTVESKYTYGPPGNISWHLSMKYPVIMLGRSLVFAIILPFYYLIVLPLALILNFFDLRLSHKTGTGLIITARK